jgi:hypothetical protein
MKSQVDEIASWKNGTKTNWPVGKMTNLQIDNLISLAGKISSLNISSCGAAVAQ